MSGHGGFSRVGGGGGDGGRLSRAGGKDFQREKKEYAEEMAKDFKYKRDSEREIKRFIQDSNEAKNGIKIDDDGEVKASKAVDKRTRQLAEKLADRMEFTDQDTADAYKDLRASTDRVYYISPKDAKDIDKFSDYKRKSKVKVTTDRSKATTDLDSLYTELYNDGANRYGLTNPNGTASKLVELNGMLSQLKANSKFDLSSPRAKEYLGGASRTDVVNEIHDRLLNYSGMAQVFYNDISSKSKKKSGGKK